MSFSRSKRFSPSSKECLPGPAHYYINWGSFGFLNPIISKYPRLTDTCEKTTPKKSGKTSPQKVEKQGQSPEQKKYSSTELQKNMAIPECSEMQMVEDAAKKQEILGVEPEEVKYQIPGLHKNVTVRESFRKRMEQAAMNMEMNPPIAANDNDDCDSITRVLIAAKSLHHSLPVGSDFFREQTAKELFIGLYENKDNHSVDDTDEASLTEGSYESSYDHNKENLQSATEEVNELLDLCIGQTDLKKKLEMLKRLSILLRRERMNLSELVDEGYFFFNKTL